MHRLLPLLLLLLLLAPALASPAQADEAPLERADVLVLARTLPDDDVAALIARRGADFRPDAAGVQALTRAGVGPKALAALRALPAQVPSRMGVLSIADVRRLARLLPLDRVTLILALHGLTTRPAADQVAGLRQAGVDSAVADAVAALVEDDIAWALHAAQGLFHRGEGEAAVTLLERHTDAGERLVPLRNLVRSVVQLEAQARELSQKGNAAGADALQTTLLRLLVDQPSNAYARRAAALAQASRGDQTQAARATQTDALALQAQAAHEKNDKVRAGLLCNATLAREPKHQAMRALRARIVRETTLRYQITRQKLQAGSVKPDAALRTITRYFRIVRAAQPDYRGLPGMRAQITELGGAIPPEDRLE